MPQLDIYIFNEAINSNLRLFLLLLFLNIFNALLLINILLKISKVTNINYVEIMFLIFKQRYFFSKKIMIEYMLYKIKIYIKKI